MAEGEKITLNVSSDELSNRVDAIPNIQKDVADILKNLPDNEKEGALKKLLGRIKTCEKTVGEYQEKITEADNISAENKTNIAGLRTDLEKANDNIDTLRKQVFGTEDNNAQTIVARINRKVENGTYTEFVTKTDSNFLKIQTQIGELQEKDKELQTETNKIAGLNTAINNLKNTVDSYSSKVNKIDGISDSLSTLKRDIQRVEGNLKKVYTILGQSYPEAQLLEDDKTLGEIK